MGKRTDQPKRGWLAALVPLSKLPVASPAPTALGVFAMNKVIAIIVELLILLLIGAGALWRDRARNHDAASSNSLAGVLPEGAAVLLMNHRPETLVALGEIGRATG